MNKPNINHYYINESTVDYYEYALDLEEYIGKLLDVRNMNYKSIDELEHEIKVLEKALEIASKLSDDSWKSKLEFREYCLKEAEKEINNE